MGSSTLGREISGRLFPAGKSPLQDRSLHHNCKLTEFGQLKHSVGEEVFNDVMSTSQVGIILKLASRSYMWCAKTCHNLLTHQLAIESSMRYGHYLEVGQLGFLSTSLGKSHS
ncbi:unnamed protein product [Microthlaspi erraticum]|uniref:Uncharacterized protein n=1 Tax=Microthlaspi erraticum TaxID=1685480 RepID=A0A6D2JP08_9BRAS|nr:unnamed protein product [Microthlaspi erraticum]